MLFSFKITFFFSIESLHRDAAFESKFFLWDSFILTHVQKVNITFAKFGIIIYFLLFVFLGGVYRKLRIECEKFYVRIIECVTAS